MANRRRSKRRSDPGLDWTFAATLIVCALIAGGFGYWHMSRGPEISQEDLAFDDEIEVDLDRLEGAYEEAYGDIDMKRVRPEWEALIEAAVEANKAQFSEPASEAQNEMTVELKLLAHQVIPATGYAGFVVSGEPLFEGCHEGLKVLLDDVRTGDLELEAAVDDLPDDDYEEYRKNCGNLLPTLVDRGLVDQNGEWSFEDAPIIVQILHRYRWAHIIYDEKRPRAQLTPYELELLDRWRLEVADGLSVDQREGYLDKLVRHDEDYNEEFARAILDYERGDLREAIDHFETLAEKRPGEHYGRYADFLRDRRDSGRTRAPREADEAT